MAVSISCGIRAKVSETSNLREIQGGDRENPAGDLCEEANACPDHVHMLVSIPPKMSVSKFMGILKGKSSLMIFDRFANLKYKYGNRHFWCRGYYVDTVGRNKTAITKYIQNQVQEDQIAEQMSMKEYIDPFTGEQAKGSK